MRVEDVKEAESEAKRFLKRCKEYRERINREAIYSSSIETTAVKRSSMDLSRSLSKLRK